MKRSFLNSSIKDKYTLVQTSWEGFYSQSATEFITPVIQLPKSEETLLVPV